MEKVDRRVRKTKTAMAKALGSLLLEKPLKSITVREIASLADINRGTFYLHYKDVYDMVEQLENEIFEKFNTIVDSHLLDTANNEITPLLTDMYVLLSENATLARVLLSKNGNVSFVNKLSEVIRKKCFENLREALKDKSNHEFEYFFSFIVSGCIGLCSTWLNNGMQESPKEMAEFTRELIMSGVFVVE